MLITELTLQKISTAGSFTIDVPDDSYAYIHIFGATGVLGTSNFRLTFNYSDATTFTTGTVTLQDWFDDWVADGLGGVIPGAESADHYYLVNGLDRMRCDVTGYEDRNDPAIFGHRFAGRCYLRH